MELPTDFSIAATSANSDTPHQAKLNAVYNNANGFLATMLGNQVVGQVLATVNEQIGTQVASQLLVGFKTIGDGLHTAGDGAQQLADGTATANNGAGELYGGATQLSDGLGQADNGAQQLTDGAERLDEGIKTAHQGANSLSAGLQQLNAATQQLGEGAGQISQGVDQLVGVANRASLAQEQLTVPLINLAAQLRSTGIPVAIELANMADQLVNQVHTQGLGQGTELMTQLGKLSDGTGQLAYQLSNPISDYRDGMQQATDGAEQLSAGSQQLTVCAAQLSSGLVQLDEGSGELALKLNQSADQVPNFSENTLDEAARNVAAPVSLNYAKDTMSLFGFGLSPMFISLGLFMGATVTFMVLRPLQRRAIDAGASPFRAVVASYLPAALIGIAQATVMVLVQRFGIGLEAYNEVGAWLAMCLASITFMSITQMFNSVFGTTVGRVLCIAFMSLQIVSSGGLYPPETQPAPLRWFHTYDPMTYTVNLLRQVLYNTDTALDPRGQQAILILVGITVLCLSISTLAGRRERQMKFKDLHPEVSV